MPTRTHLLRIILACMLSGLIAGVLTASQCWRAGGDCRIAAIQALSSEPVPWTLWLHWINWLPGAVFGLLFAAARADWRPYLGRRVFLYALASTIVYMLAGLIFSAFLDFAGGDELSLIVWIWPAALAAGGMGALLLGIAARQLLRSPANPLGRVWLPALAGALLGLVFAFICSYGEQRILVAWPLAFLVWQLGVGLALAAGGRSTRAPLGVPSRTS